MSKLGWTIFVLSQMPLGFLGLMTVSACRELQREKKSVRNIERRLGGWLASEARKEKLKDDLELAERRHGWASNWLEKLLLATIISGVLDGLVMWGAIGSGWPLQVRASIGLLILNIVALGSIIAPESDWKYYFKPWVLLGAWAIAICSCLLLASGIVWHGVHGPILGHVAQGTAAPTAVSSTTSSPPRGNSPPLWDNGMFWNVVIGIGTVVIALGTLALIYLARKDRSK
jgi:hypothetical protein